MSTVLVGLAAAPVLPVDPSDFMFEWSPFPPPQAGGGPLVWVAVPVLGVTQGLNTLLRVTLLVDLYGTARFGTLNGRSATPVVLARALAPLGAAALASATGGYAVPFAVLTVAAGAAGYLGGGL